ncbi:hypothetical protein TrLO_g8319 [Triparma laevis f. longispina]|uniref:Chromosome transmission fidelity protein 8 n=1 Tax=Triparma laevis f. longispina TaxID=1714387 RepID=A0A9W7C7A6_9STRA|nr:hypothetical protein TrLO_g8319 [Triparma laevis f. longispina]
MRIPFTLKRSSPSTTNTTSPSKKSKPTSSSSSSSSHSTISGLTKHHAIELNGQLVVPSGRVSEGVETELGLFTVEGGVPTLLVGTHEIKGKIIKLKKPLLLVRKQKSEPNSTTPLPVLAEGIITEKYLFNGYPKTIMREKH